MNGWVKISSMLTVFFFCLLAACSNRVLIVGGRDNSGNFLASAEIYDPSTRTFINSRALMSTPRLSATATLLSTNMSVLIVGGQSPNALDSAEIYQTLTDSYTPVSGLLKHIRVSHTATLLNSAVVSGEISGNVLITGGDQFSEVGTAELFNPATGTFFETGNMTTSRNQHTAILISHCGCAADGSVLIVGGYDNKGNVLASAELYDPKTQKFTATGAMLSPRFRHTATLLDNGTVLIAGGASQLASRNNINPALNTAEIYDPKTGKFTPTKAPMTAYREAHAANLLQDGTVLLTGGQDNHFIIENTAEIYNPMTGMFTATSESCAGAPPPAGCMISGRDFHMTQILDDGTVLIAGGINSNFETVASAEIYNPATKTFTATGSMSTSRSGAGLSKIVSIF